MKNNILWSEGDYFISTDKELLDRDVIFNYLHNDAYWAMGIPREAVNRIIENSFCFGVYIGVPSKEFQLIGFARVVSDFVRFAYLADVFILPTYRGKGLSKILVKIIVSYPDFQGVHFCLGTKDAHSLYEKHGNFQLIGESTTWMVKQMDLKIIFERF